MMRRLRCAAVGLVLIATILVAVGVGQGSAPSRSLSSPGQAQREQAAVTAAGVAARQGEVVFARSGCNACHTLAAGGYGGRLGPRLDTPHLDESPGDIEADIVDPPTHIPGYEPGLMPENFAARLTSRQLMALASFIHAAAAGASSK